MAAVVLRLSWGHCHSYCIVIAWLYKNGYKSHKKCHIPKISHYSSVIMWNLKKSKSTWMIYIDSLYKKFMFYYTFMINHWDYIRFSPEGTDHRIPHSRSHIVSWIPRHLLVCHVMHFSQPSLYTRSRSQTQRWWLKAVPHISIVYTVNNW